LLHRLSPRVLARSNECTGGSQDHPPTANPVKALAEVLQNAYAVRPFPAWNLANLGLWTAAGAVFAIWRFRWQAT